MRYKLLNTTSIIALCFFFQACAQQVAKESSDVITSKGGYELTEKHFALYLEALKDYEIDTGEAKQSQEIVKSELKQAFLEDPKNIFNELNALSEDMKQPTLPSSPNDNKHKATLAQGNLTVRQVLGNDIGQMQFDSQVANNFRAYMASSLLTSGSSRGDGGGSISSNSQIQFCTDGSYAEYLSAHLGVTVPGMDVGGYDEDTISGYWEVASLPNGMLIILLYSTHPLVLEDFPNGIVPFLVAQYTADFVALPNDDGYRRTINYCN